MAAGLGFKTFTVGEVLTAADTNGYLMQGVLVFADSAARSAAITSPEEGQYSYLKDSNSTWYYSGSAWVASGGSPLTTKGDLYGYSTTDARVPIGTNSQVLTADSTAALGLKWATPASGSMTLLSTTSWTTASQTISSISGSYKNLEIWVTDFRSTIADDVNLRLNGTTSTAYQTIQLVGTVAGTASTYSSAGSTVIKLSSPSFAPQTSDNNSFIRFRINDYTNAVTNKIIDFNSTYSTASDVVNVMGQGNYYATPAAITSVTLWIPTAGTPTGTIYIYGVN